MKNVTRQSERIYLVDRFEMPLDSRALFETQMNRNQEFIARLEGLVSHEVMIREENDRLVLMTVAEWANQQALDLAMKLVKAHHQETGFDPTGFLRQLGATMDREQFSALSGF